MNVFRWICRYLFFALLLAVAVLWCIKCQETIDRLEAVTNSPAYIDIVIDNYPEALELQQRTDFFYSQRLYGIIAGGGIALFAMLLVLWNIYGGRVRDARKKKSEAFLPPVAEQPMEPWAAPPAQPTMATGFYVPADIPNGNSDVFCRNCGARVDSGSRFCAKCGTGTEYPT